MRDLFKSAKHVLATIAMGLAMMQVTQAQRLDVAQLIDMRGKSVEDVQMALEKKGWVYRGECGGEETEKRHCFKVGDNGEGLAAVLYVIEKGGEQSLEYTVYRPGLIAQLQSSLKKAAVKLMGKEPIGENVNLNVYEKNEHVLVARGGADKKYYSLQVMRKPAYEQLQASR